MFTCGEGKQVQSSTAQILILSTANTDDLIVDSEARINEYYVNFTIKDGSTKKVFYRDPRLELISERAAKRMAEADRMTLEQAQQEEMEYFDEIQTSKPNPDRDGVHTTRGRGTRTKSTAGLRGGRGTRVMMHFMELLVLLPNTYLLKNLRKKDSNLVEPKDVKLYLETYKRKLRQNYKSNKDELKTKYLRIQEMVDSGKIAEADALVSGGKNRAQNWIVGMQGKISGKNSTHAPTDNYVQELIAKIRQCLEVDLEAKVNIKVHENMSLVLKKLGEVNPDLKFSDIIM